MSDLSLNRVIIIVLAAIILIPANYSYAGDLDDVIIIRSDRCQDAAKATRKLIERGATLPLPAYHPEAYGLQANYPKLLRRYEWDPFKNISLMRQIAAEEKTVIALSGINLALPRELSVRDPLALYSRLIAEGKSAEEAFFVSIGPSMYSQEVQTLICRGYRPVINHGISGLPKDAVVLMKPAQAAVEAAKASSDASRWAKVGRVLATTGRGVASTGKGLVSLAVSPTSVGLAGLFAAIGMHADAAALDDVSKATYGKPIPPGRTEVNWKEYNRIVEHWGTGSYWGYFIPFVSTPADIEIAKARLLQSYLDASVQRRLRKEREAKEAAQRSISRGGGCHCGDLPKALRIYQRPSYPSGYGSYGGGYGGPLGGPIPKKKVIDRGCY